MNRSERLVPKATVCRALRVRPQRFTYWARTGLLEVASAGFTLAQAVQLAVLVAFLKSDISLQALRPGWEAVKAQLAGVLPVGDVYLIWDSDRFTARVVTGKRALADAVIGIPRPQVILLKQWLELATSGFAEGRRRRMSRVMGLTASASISSSQD